MKTLFLLLFVGLVSRALGVSEFSVRAYLLPSLESLSEVGGDVVLDPFSEEKPPEEFIPKTIQSPLFKSRFFNDGKLFDLSRFMMSCFPAHKTEIQAVFDSESKRLVVRTDLETHDILRDFLKGLHSYQVKTEMTLFSVPGVVLRMSHAEMKNATWARSVSCLHELDRAAVVRDGGIDLEIKSNVESTGSRKVIGSHLILTYGKEEIEVRTLVSLLRGDEKFVVLGGSDDRETWAFRLKQDLIIADGTAYGDWILLEEGVFNPEEKFARGLDDSKEVQVFPAPRFLYLDILPLVGEDDELPDHTKATGPVPFRSVHPELGGGKWKDLYEVSYIWRDSGYPLKEGELFLYRQSVSRFYAKMGEENLKVLARLFEASRPHPPLQFQFSLTEITTEQRLEAGALGKGGLDIRRYVCGHTLPGQIGTFRVDNDWGVEMEIQEIMEEGGIEGRVTLTGEKSDEPRLKTGFFCRSKVPLILSQSWDGENWTSLVLTVIRGSGS